MEIGIHTFASANFKNEKGNQAEEEAFASQAAILLPYPPRGGTICHRPAKMRNRLSGAILGEAASEEQVWGFL